ncbi:hypothetical protein [Nocardia tenerifensis]|uniref:hypothetical protein n=1 Tax=Nocardia tenerifensis TaxID=228006 RepID=UPI0002D904D1|nr:hypothetical protein [Nocardia tenerifensis]
MTWETFLGVSPLDPRRPFPAAAQSRLDVQAQDSIHCGARGGLRKADVYQPVRESAIP